MTEAAEPVRILVADDNQVDRMVLSTIVRREGYVVEEAEDGPDTLRRYQSFRPQMVLLDALMPGLDGFEVARQIKALAGEDFVPIIFLTSLTEADALARALEAGGDDFLSKPYNQIVLKAKLNALQRMRAMHVTLQHQRDEIGRHHAHLLREQEAAKAVFDKVAHTGDLEESFIRYLISPLAIFNGDVLLAARNPSGNLYVLLGDFTGHGLTAAIGAMPLADTFYGMTEKGFVPAEILREANRKLLRILPKGYFCCATLVALNFQKGTMEFWNGGLPPGCLLRAGSGALVHLESTHLPLGIRDDARFDATTRVIPMAPGDKLVMCTDGIVEARNEQGEAFGFERFDDIVREADPGAGAFEGLKRAVYRHIGGTGRDDDITLVELGMLAPEQASMPVAAAAAVSTEGSADWEIGYQLGPRSLRESNPLPMLQQIVVDVPQLRSRAGAIYTVLAELYSNALEHGLMGLDSSLKHSASGFAVYYEARERAMQTLDGFIRFDFRCEIDGSSGRLVIAVTDSGPGFDYRARLCARGTGGASGTGGGGAHHYHGRGLRLMQSLCQSVTYHGCGNHVEVEFSWSDEDVSAA